MNVSLHLDLPLPEYRRHFAAVSRSTLLQDSVYGAALARTGGMRARYGLIRVDGESAGIFQWFERSALAGLLHALTLDRGPLWLDGFGTRVQAEAFFRAFDGLYPRRLGRRRRIIPELPVEPEAGAAGYSTHWLNLDREPDILRAGLLGRWRNVLVRAERLQAAGELSVAWETTPERLAQAVELHLRHRAETGYHGADAALLRRLLLDYAKAGGLLLGTACDAAGLCSLVVMLRHGRAATYQLAWNGASGRWAGANNLLLWQALPQLRAQGVRWLDLGGFNAAAPGLKRYKAGLGGEEVHLAGMFG